MKYCAVFLFVLLFIFPLCAYEWQSWGPTGIHALNSYFHGDFVYYGVFGTTGSIWVDDCFGFNEYDTWLPVMGAAGLDTTTFLFVAGDGSDSDGLYVFDRELQGYETVMYLMYPNFIEHFGDRGFYMGDENGLYFSADGSGWNAVSYFDGMDCLAMEAYDEHLVVSTQEDGIIISSDSGSTWDMSQSGYLWISDMAYTIDGTLYGVFPDSSWSSGLWSSYDYGNTWQNEFYSISMSCVGIGCDNAVFVGWQQSYLDHEGVGIWNPDISELTIINNGLPDLHINSLELFPLVNCPAMLACTNSGMYFVSNYTDIINAQKLTRKNDPQLIARPNPFNPETVIEYTLKSQNAVSINIYDINGRLVRQLMNSRQHTPGSYSVSWNGKTDAGATASSGIYMVRLDTGNYSKAIKVALIK